MNRHQPRIPTSSVLGVCQIILSIEDGKIVDWDAEVCREFIEDLRKDEA